VCSKGIDAPVYQHGHVTTRVDGARQMALHYSTATNRENQLEAAENLTGAGCCCWYALLFDSPWAATDTAAAADDNDDDDDGLLRSFNDEVIAAAKPRPTVDKQIHSKVKAVYFVYSA